MQQKIWQAFPRKSSVYKYDIDRKKDQSFLDDALATIDDIAKILEELPRN